jgi:predicted LPLAT superfamily acyltransferase
MRRLADGEVEAPRAPEWLGRPERSNTLALRFMVWVATALGRRAARLLLYPILAYFVAFSPRTRAASRRYLDRALGRRAGLADVFRHYHAFASVLLDRVFLLKGQLGRFEVRVHGGGVIEEMVAGGRGCVLLGSHLGSFEVIRTAGMELGFGISMVMYEDNARKTGAVLEAVNPGLAAGIIPLGRVDSILKVEAALARGEIVGMLADRTIQGGGTVRCAFLGEPAPFPTGPIRIAAMLDRPIALMFGVYRGGNRYDVHFERLEGAGTLARLRGAELEALLQRYAGRLEHYCRSAPYNWFNFYDFWR